MKQINLIEESYYHRELPVKSIRISQPMGEFYIGVIKSKDLREITYSDVRRMEGERGFESYLGIQRPLSPARVKDLKSYVRTQDACFPTAVLLSVPARCAEFNPDEGVLLLKPYKAVEGDEYSSVPYVGLANVIDGQHRIAGLEGYEGDNFDINVSIFVDIDVSSEAQIFSTVNLAQTKVNKSLVYDLFDLATKKSPQKLCHEIAVTLDKQPDSPFFNRIKRLGSAQPHNLPGSITQAAFVQALIKYISAEPMKDRDMYLRGKKPLLDGGESSKQIFRKFMVDDKEFDLTDIIWDYFSAVAARWPSAWNSTDRGIVLSKTNGFMALMRFLKDAYHKIGKEKPSREDFDLVFSRIELDDSDFSTERYKPGTSGESALYKDLIAARKLI
jgi:DGQHR domain-containing protein